MGSNSFFKVRESKFFRIAALVYGLVFCNVGAVILYEKLSQSPVAFDATFRTGAGCLLLGLVGLALARRCRQQPK